MGTSPKCVNSHNCLEHLSVILQWNVLTYLTFTVGTHYIHFSKILFFKIQRNVKSNLMEIFSNFESFSFVEGLFSLLSFSTDEVNQPCSRLALGQKRKNRREAKINAFWGSAVALPKWIMCIQFTPLANKCYGKGTFM